MSAMTDVGKTTGRVTGNMRQDLYDAACGCPACDAGVQPGHFTCSSSPEELLKAESEGIVYRAYEGSGWHWFYTPRRS